MIGKRVQSQITTAPHVALPPGRGEQLASDHKESMPAESVRHLLGVIRSASKSSSELTAPPVVQEALESPGQSLDESVRKSMEPRFGHDFSQVRVHADAKAGESARAVNALAYTVGRDIVFGAGQYAPRTHEGRRLIAHELTHTIQQGAEQHSAPYAIGQPGNYTEQVANEASSRTLLGHDYRPSAAAKLHVARQGAAAATLPNPLSRAQFDAIMKIRYRVKKISTATFRDWGFGDLKAEDWQEWDPGPSSSVYNWIIDAFVNFEKTFGGLPEVNEIVFFEVHYLKDAQNHAYKDPEDPGASYQWGKLMIYHKILQGNRMLLLNQEGAVNVPLREQTVTPEQAVTRNITHELGHGVAETALTQRTDLPPGADDKLFKEYCPAVGWAKDGNLYDIGEQAVQDAFRDKVIPPSQFQITVKTATAKIWKEKPLTAYMASSPGEDFAEAIMAYANEPERLDALSPKRFAFIKSRKALWIASGQPKMNIWERAKRGGPARVLKPSHKPTFWERIIESSAAGAK